MINIRNNLFETNSSSVHAICWSKNNDWEIPNTLHFGFGEYGWENSILATTYELASYLYTALCSIYEGKELSDYKNYIYDTLGRHGCECTFAEPSTAEWGYFDSGYVDHSYELLPFIESLRKSEKKLLRFLFSPKSFIMTGNDNSENFYNWLDYFEESGDKNEVEMFVKGN